MTSPEHSEDAPVCMVCGEPLEGVERFVRCAACETPYHDDCWAFNGACSLYGCESCRCLPVGDAHILSETLVIDADSEQPRKSFRVSGGLSGTDVAHLSIIALPLFWLPVAVEGGWLLALNLLFIAFPLLMFAFQVRCVTLEGAGLRLGYLFWSRCVRWEEISSFGVDPLCGYALRLKSGSVVAVPAQPGELDELESELDLRLRERSRRD